MQKSIKIITGLILVLYLNIYSAEVWSGYVNIESDYILNSGETLTILPGTVVRFAHDAKLIIEGQLLAEGTSSEMIKLTSYDPEFSEYDFWGGIEFLGAEKDTSKIDYCIIENIERRDGNGSILAEYSLVNITNSFIHHNKADMGGAIQVNNCILNISHNKIENNTALYGGGGIYISNRIDDKYTETFIYKNIIKDNKVTLLDSENDGGGGIFVDEVENYNSHILIQENDIISNSLTNSLGLVGGSGAGILVRTRLRYSVEILGNRIMYNRSFYGAGLTVLHKSTSAIAPIIIKNNIISNNTASDYSGGVYYNTDQITNPASIIFENNNVVNNLNLSSKTGSGGFYVRYNSTLQNYFGIKNCIFWNNSRAGTTNDIGAYPSIYPGAFVEYSNSTVQIEGTGNISANSLFQRSVDYYGCDPYENYLRADYHLSLESPCIDAGDTKTELLEADEEVVNMGAWGNTNEATPSHYDYISYTESRDILVKAGETLLLDCRSTSKEIVLNQVIVEDGGDLFIAPSLNTPVISIKTLIIEGKKIGDLYTTRIQRMTTEQPPEFLYNSVNIENINCTGVEFNEMSLNINSQAKSVLLDSKVYVSTYNENLTGVQVSSPDFDISSNTIDNFGIGIYYHPMTKFDKATKGRIANNTINFDADAVHKGETKAKGIKVENCDAQVTDNNIDNPNEGIEVSSSSGRIANNTINFDADAVNKGVTEKKGIYLFGGADYSVDHNTIICDDVLTPTIHAIHVSDSYINAYYNIISFCNNDPEKNERVGFFTTNLSDNSIFINNTLFNTNYGILDNNTGINIRLFNNIFYTPTSTYLTSSNRNLVLYNNNVSNSGEINWDAVKDEKNTIYEIPLFQSSKINDFYLWRESKCIDAGMYMEEYHISGVNFFGEAPDIGALEFYQEVNLSAPANLNITATSTSVNLTWSSVANAASYKIYRSADPYTSDWKDPVASTTSTSIVLSTGGAVRYFYRITASTESVKNIEDSINKNESLININSHYKTKIRKINIKQKENSNN